MDFESFIKLIFVGFGLFMLFQLVTKGFKGTIFGGKVKNTFGEVKLERRNGTGGNIKIHIISSNGNDLIGIEVVKKSLFGVEVVPALLTKSQARQLINLLGSAANET